jgi:cyclic pyranopterin phosphate synthase
MTERVIALVDAGRRKPLPPAAGTAEGAARDRLGRTLRDLRISVTDRCNFRCTYCMPREVFGDDYRFLPHDQLLSFEEIARLAKIFTEQGIEKIRLTGGEPLLRRNVERLVEMLAAITRPDGGAIELTLTTNGSLLARKARALKDAGLRRVTVSLDALDDPTFMAMNDADFPVAKVLAGIDAADAAGLAPVKINMVVKRGVNEHSILPMARRFKGSGHVLRFIEFMDVGATNGWRMDDVIPSRDRVGNAARSDRSELPRRSCGALALPRRLGRDRRHFFGNPGVLPLLHPRPDFHRRHALYLPVRHFGLRLSRLAARRQVGCRNPRRDRGGVGRTR